MRVLHIGAGNLYGGVETVLVTLARLRALCPELEPEFALCFKGRAADEIAATNAPLHILGEVRTRRPLSVLRARGRLKALVARRRFDAVICHSPWAQAIFAPAVRSADVPLVFWLHDAPSGNHWLERWASKARPDLAICSSRFNAAALGYVYPRAQAAVVYCPVARPSPRHYHEREAVRAELETPSDATVVIQVSRMEEWKGHRLHLNALARLRDEPQWACWMVGGAQRPHEQRYLDTLRAQAIALGIADRIRFVGQRGDVGRLLAAADIHCQPNTGAEPFGITFIEALYSGLPVVTTAIGGAVEIINDACGILVPPNDPTALASALGRLIEDREERERLGAAGPDRAASLCDPHAQLTRLHAILAQAADANAMRWQTA
jgi:glycosyltransferase involved in cell wall biosynthesis